MSPGWMLEPNATVKARYDVLFGLLRPFFDGKPWPAFPSPPPPRKPRATRIPAKGIRPGGTVEAIKRGPDRSSRTPQPLTNPALFLRAPRTAARLQQGSLGNANVLKIEFHRDQAHIGIRLSGPNEPKHRVVSRLQRGREKP